MEQNTTTDATLAHQRLLDGWLTIWNGDYSALNDIVAPEFALHASMLDGGDGSAVRGPDGLVGWVAQTRAAFTEMVFTVEVGPIIDRDQLAIRWIAVGTYGGGFPGATVPVGTAIRFTGTDILRIEQDLIAEYWVNSDVHVLLATLGVQF
ncbi:ester cyclase [Nocardia sp. NPDC051756]|uniref:ester cyclase n=1 Tax=Nocardia sp. NPDC051756 TaxID=3154751 RepID=UPI003433B9D4